MKKWKNGDIYEGNYKEDKKCGFGRYCSASGEKFEGKWIDGKRSGKGKYLMGDKDGENKSSLLKEGKVPKYESKLWKKKL